MAKKTSSNSTQKSSSDNKKTAGKTNKTSKSSDNAKESGSTSKVHTSHTSLLQNNQVSDVLLHDHREEDSNLLLPLTFDIFFVRNNPKL